MASSYAHNHAVIQAVSSALTAVFGCDSLRSLVPPKIASASAISGAPGAKRMESVLEFYSKVGQIQSDDLFTLWSADSGT